MFNFGNSSKDWVNNCQTNLENFSVSYNEIRRNDTDFTFHTPETFHAFSQRVISKGEAEGRSNDWINHALQLHYWSDIGESFKAFSVTSLLRTGTLVESIVRELQNDSFLSAAILARSLLESQATFRRQQLQLKEKLYARLNVEFGRHKSVEIELDKLIIRSIYGATHSTSSKDQKPTNIQTQIDKLGDSTKCDKLPSAYEYLCQMAHPTFFGTRLFMDVTQVDEFGAHQGIISDVPGIGAIEATYPTLWVLSWTCLDIIDQQLDFAESMAIISKEQLKHSSFVDFKL